MGAENVSVAQTGIVAKVPSTLVVTSAVSDLGPSSVTYGLVSEDGVGIENTTSTDTIKAWQNSAIVRTVNSDASVTFTIVLIENTQPVRELYYGSAEANGKIAWNPSKRTKGSFVIDYIDTGYGEEGEFLTGRYHIKRGEVTEVESITLQNGEPVGYGVTITAFPDENGEAVDVYHESDIEGVDPEARASTFAAPEFEDYNV